MSARSSTSSKATCARATKASMTWAGRSRWSWRRSCTWRSTGEFRGSERSNPTPLDKRTNLLFSSCFWVQVLPGVPLLLGFVVHYPGPAVHHRVWIPGELGLNFWLFFDGHFHLLPLCVYGNSDGWNSDCLCMWGAAPLILEPSETPWEFPASPQFSNLYLIFQCSCCCCQATTSRHMYTH